MANTPDENRLFPVFLKLNLRPTLVVGGGAVGLEKIHALLKNDPEARIRLVAPEIRPELIELASTHNIELNQRAFRKSDLKNIGILILATNNRKLHEEVCEIAREKNLLVNVADTPDLCDFYLGSTVTKGNLKIGISTNGQSPTLAKRIREMLEDALPDEIDALLSNLRNIRDRIKGDFGEKVRKLNEVTAVLKT